MRLAGKGSKKFYNWAITKMDIADTRGTLSNDIYQLGVWLMGEAQNRTDDIGYFAVNASDKQFGLAIEKAYAQFKPYEK